MITVYIMVVLECMNSDRKLGLGFMLGVEYYYAWCNYTVWSNGCYFMQSAYMFYV